MLKENIMINVYVSLVKKHKKTIDEVPEIIREEVRKILEDEGYEF